jgi:uncharacterized protein YbjQ (UPF0145 family)
VGLVPYVAVTPEGMNKIFEAMLRDDMQTWVLSAPEGGAQVVYAVLTTSVLVDPASNSRNLVIYSLSGYKTITKALYEEGVEGLKEYAKAKGCASIIAYTSVPAVERIAMVLGAERAAVLRWRVQ